MKTRSVPAIIMLLAGFIAAVAGIVAHMEVADFMKMLLIVLILFYVFGSIVQVIIDHNFKEMQDEQTTDGEAEETEEEPSAAEDEEAAVDEDK